MVYMIQVPENLKDLTKTKNNKIIIVCYYILFEINTYR